MIYYAELIISRANRLKVRTHHPLKLGHFTKKVPSDSVHNSIHQR